MVLSPGFDDVMKRSLFVLFFFFFLALQFGEKKRKKGASFQMVASLHKVTFKCIYSYFSYFTICICYYLFVILHLHIRIKYLKLSKLEK